MKSAGSELIKVSQLDLMNTFEDNMCVGFSCDSEPLLDTFEITSWNLVTNYNRGQVSAKSAVIEAESSSLCSICYCRLSCHLFAWVVGLDNLFQTDYHS